MDLDALLNQPILLQIVVELAGREVTENPVQALQFNSGASSGTILVAFLSFSGRSLEDVAANLVLVHMQRVSDFA